MNDSIKLSVIIVSWNVAEQIERCLLSIDKYLSKINKEVIVIDNNSTDQTKDLIKQRFPGVKLIINSINKGFAAANNQGAQIAQGEYFLILNPDTEFIDESLGSALAFMDQQQNIGICGINIINRDQSDQLSIRPFPDLYSQIITLGKLNNIWPQLNKHYLSINFDYHQSQSVASISGACFLIERKVWSQLNGFEEHFLIWFEEVDLCYRCQQSGLTVYYYAPACIIHDGAQSFSQLLPWAKQKLFNRSLLYYFRQHQPGWQLIILRLLLPFNYLLTILQTLVSTTKNVYTIVRSKN